MIFAHVLTNFHTIFATWQSVPESHAPIGTSTIPLSLSPQHHQLQNAPGTIGAAGSSPTPPSHMAAVAGGPTILAVAGSGPISASPEQIAKLQSELDIVTMNMTVLGEMLTELRPGQESPDDYRLLTELTQTCHEMQTRIVELIGRITHDEITAELLRLNDELNNLFLRHQRYEKNRDPQSAGVTTAGPAALLGAAMGVPAASAALSALSGKFQRLYL